MTSLLSLPRSDFNAPREGEDFKKRGFALLKHPLAPGLVLLRNI